MPDPEMEMKRAKVAKLATERNRQARIDRGIDITTAEEALGVNELLEMILSYLPAKELFRVQRVSTRWKSAIQGSQGLQRKVFITVKNKSPKILIATNSQGQPMADARYIAGDDRDDLQVRALTPAQLQTIVGIGPTAYVDPITLVRPNHGFHCIISNHSILDRTSPFDLDHFNTWNWTVCDRLLDNKLASIRNTFATDPVCQKAEILVHTEYGREANGVRTKVVYSEFDPRGFVEASPRGLKMGDILDTISDQPGSLEIFVDSGPRCGEHVVSQSVNLALLRSLLTTIASIRYIIREPSNVCPSRCRGTQRI